MIGLIVPSNNTVILPEIYSALPEGVTAYETRMRVEGDLTPEALERMIAGAEGAADLLRQTGVDVICYCCMASSIVKGWNWERDLLARFTSHARKETVSANSALKRALTALRARRLALVTPYPETFNALLPAFFAQEGFEVKAVAGVPIANVAAVRALSPDQLLGVVRAIAVEEVDAVCLLATDMQTFPIIAAIEREIGRPVATSNQALLWASLRALGVPDPVPGLGKLFYL